MTIHMSAIRNLMKRQARAAWFSVLIIISVTFAVEAASPGGLDPSFGVGGKVITTTLPVVLDVADVAVQIDGKTVAAATCGGVGTTDFCLLRYNSDGSLDQTFGIDGRVSTAFVGGGVAKAIAIQYDGR